MKLDYETGEVSGEDPENKVLEYIFTYFSATFSQLCVLEYNFIHS